MATEIRWRRGTTAEHSTFTGAAGEITVDTTKDVVVVHDGVTAGGFAGARENHNHTGVYEPADATILKDADIGVNVQAYDADIPTVAASQAEMEAGTEVALRSMSPLRVAQAIAALGTSSSGGQFKNKIIGGDFTTNPWQRGTSFTAPVTGDYTADRWKFTNTSAAVLNVLKTADGYVATGEPSTFHCLHLDVTTADASIAAGDLVLIRQMVEGYNASTFGFGYSGTRYVTLSFLHKHTKTGTYCVSLQNSAADRSYVAEYTQDVSDTWEKASVTIPVDTTGTWLNDSGVGLRVAFIVASGSTYQTSANTWQTGNYLATANQVNALDSTSNNFKIALVQLEAGSVATPFETRSVGQELALCQRYYEKSFPIGTAPAQNVAGGALIIPQIVGASTQQYLAMIKYSTTKRATPGTTTLYNPYAANAQIRNYTNSTDWSGCTITSTDSHCYVFGTTAAGSSAGNSAAFQFTADAEL